MVSFGRKNTFRKFLFSKFVLILILMMSVWLAFSVFERYQVERDMAGRREAIETSYQDLTKRKAALEAQVEYLHGEAGIESEIRRHFDVVKEGEQVVIIVEDEAEEPLPLNSVSKPEVEQAKPWYQFW